MTWIMPEGGRRPGAVAGLGAADEDEREDDGGGDGRHEGETHEVLAAHEGEGEEHGGDGGTGDDGGLRCE